MPRNPKTVTSPVHDPALVAVFGRSRKSYEQNRDELVAKLEVAAQRTRAAAPAEATPVKQRAIASASASSPETIHARTPKSRKSSGVVSTRESRISA